MVVALRRTSTASVKGGFFAQYSTSLSGFSTGGARRRKVAQALSVRGLRPLKEAIITLLGATAGSAALSTRTRVAAAEEMGGVRTIETVTEYDDTTAAGDVTAITADILSYNSYDGTPIANGDGNPLGTR